MKNSERSRPELKPRWLRLRRQKQKQQPQRDWYTTADAEGNVKIHPIR